MTVLDLPFVIEAVLFDLDDTLYSRDDAFYRWANSFVRTFMPVQHEQQVSDIVRRIISLDNHAITEREKLFMRLRQEYPVLQKMTVRQLVKMFREELSPHIIPDATMFSWLAELQEAKRPFGVITNGSTAHQRRKLAQLGINKMTSCIFISQSFGFKKPDATIFLAAAACLKRAPQDILFVGDHPVADIHGAHAVGMKTAWVQGNQIWPEELPYVADLRITKS
jgi:putative hydrolase of the HAD superfamily